MALFRTDYLVLTYSNIPAAKQWWIDTFGCKLAKLPVEWDDPLPSDIALVLSGFSEPTILLFDRAEAEQAGLERPHDRPVLFTDDLNKAHQYLLSKGLHPGPIQSGGTQFFEVRDSENNAIEICKEP